MVMFSLFTIYYLGEKMKVVEVVENCRMYVGLYKMFTEFCLVNSSLQNTRCKWENTIEGRVWIGFIDTISGLL